MARRVTRRDFLGAVAALSALGLPGSLQAAGKGKARHKHARPDGKLPLRTDLVIRGAYVMTMDPGLGDIADGDVLVRGGEIAEVGRDIKARGVETLAGAGMIVLPGFVETHWHMWNTLLRSLSGDKKERGYFPTVAALGKVFTPDDMYQGTRLAAAEAINGGITFVHDWCHNVRAPEYAEADLRALKECGLRGRFSYGSPQGHPAAQPIDLADFERLSRDWARYAHDGLLSLGLAWRAAFTDATTMLPTDAARKEFETARRLRLPISVHVSNSRSRSGQIAVLARENFLASDVQLIHAIWFTPEELKSVSAAGSPISLSPFTELRIGFGFPKTGDLITAGVPIGLSVDTTALSGNADMFAIMKAVQNVENALTENEFKLPARRVLEFATIEGARSMAVDAAVGSLKPGKRADLIMVDTRAVNLGVFSDPAHLLVEAAQPANVDTVVIDGRILKRNGKLTAIDVQKLVSEANAAFAAVKTRANWL
ncbi:MAG TPA: amidohydrolase family protein [Burkholderiales bacterium]|nr:amidohydrolase family protein [Burkholderiales bacterium]